MKITKENLAMMGDSSLIGALVNHGELPNDKKKVTLSFEQVGDAQRRAKGFDHITIPEFVVPAMLRDVVRLTKEGYTVEITEHHKE